MLSLTTFVRLYKREICEGLLKYTIFHSILVVILHNLSLSFDYTPKNTQGPLTELP